MTNDHTVPQAYLRRFAQRRKAGGAFICATQVDGAGTTFQTNVRNVAAVNGFYWGTDLDGVPHHDMERLLGQIENAAIRPFNVLLDHHVYALPQSWPLKPDLRVRLALWMSAQILRTTRQRQRLSHLVSEAAGGGETTEFANSTPMRNLHNALITQHIRPLASILYSRPWGLGFADACLITSDVPVVILNGQDDTDQLKAASYWDLMLPLDPHRFLFLPGRDLMDDPEKRVDHRLKLDGGMGLFLGEAIRDAAERHTFHHPDHPPYGDLDIGKDRPRLGRPWAGSPGMTNPQYIVSYPTLPNDFTVERKWVDGAHPARKLPT